MDMRAALLQTCRDLHGKYARHPWVSLLMGGPMDSPPAPEDENLRAWMDAFATVMEPTKRKRALDALASARAAAAQVKPANASDRSDASKRIHAALQKSLGDAWRHDIPYLLHVMNPHDPQG